MGNDIDAWDTSDDEGATAGITITTVNPYCKKRMTIELSALMANVDQPMTADQINDVFKTEFGYDFPVANFHTGGDLEDYLMTVREFVIIDNPEEPPRFLANMQYKYTLLHKLAVGGKPRKAEEVKSVARVKQRKQKLVHVANGIQREQEAVDYGGRARTVEGGRMEYADKYTRAASTTTWNNYRTPHPSAHHNSKTTAPKGPTVARQLDVLPPAGHSAAKPNGSGEAEVKESILDDLLEQELRPIEEAIKKKESKELPKPVVAAKIEEKKESKAKLFPEIPVPVVTKTVVEEPPADVLDVLKKLFRANGDKCQRKFIVREVMDIIEKFHPESFRLEQENGNQWIIFDQCAIKKATVSTLLWLLEAKCVASREEPFHTCKIVEILDSGVIVIGSLLGGATGTRLEEISQKLKFFFDEEKLQKASLFVSGKTYVTRRGDQPARVITLEKGSNGGFKAILVDRPCIVEVYPDDMWEVPAGFTLHDVPGNIFLAKMRGHAEISQKMKEEMVEAAFNPTSMVFLGGGEGMREVDWVKGGQWFSERIGGQRNSGGPTVEEAKRAFEIRDLSSYSDFSLKYTQVLPPFASRTPAQPDFFQKLYIKIEQEYIREPAESKRFFAQEGLRHLHESAKQFRPENQKDEEAALRLSHALYEALR